MKKKRVYVFDWDCNIMEMPTKIQMEEFINHKWSPVELNSRQWAKIKRDNEMDLYRHPSGISDPFINFNSNPQFIRDLHVALEYKWYGPSFSKFKECLMYGNDFAIITARGHSPEVIMAGIIMIIGKTFLENELTMMIDNVGDLNAYLYRQQIYPVNAAELDFPEIHEGGLPDSVSIRKIICLDRFVDEMVGKTTEIEFDGKFSIGISDDDSSNIKTIKEFIESDLKLKYPEIHFVVYDTSNPNQIIKKPII